MSKKGPVKKRDANQIAKNIVDMVTGTDSEQINWEEYFEGKPIAKIVAETLPVPISELKGNGLHQN